MLHSPPTATQIQYMEAHIKDNLKPAIIISNTICLTAAYIGVTMRFISRFLIQAGFKADDWLILAALALYTAFILVVNIGTIYGSGRHVVLVTNQKALNIVVMTVDSLYQTVILCTKISILCLYNRIFPQRGFRNASIAIAGFIAASAVASTLTSLLQCVPISLLWDSEIEGHCVNYGSWVRATGIINIVTDFILLILPTPLVWKIKTSTTKRWQLTITFILGGCACIVSIVRLFFAEGLNNSADPSWDTVQFGFCSTVELCVGILAACIATWRPLFKRIVHRSTTSTSSQRPVIGKTNFVGNNSRESPEQIKMTARVNVMNGRVRHGSNDDDRRRIYARIPEPEEGPGDERW